MICFIALAVFGVLSIFSAKYRPYARASVDCVFRRLTLRPCNTTLEEQVKSESVAALLPISPALARFTNRYWEAISWAFTILMFVSLAYVLFGLYNFVQFGTCDPADPEGCIYNKLLGTDPSSLVAPTSLAGFSAGNSSASVTFIEFGCYTCQYTARAEPGVQELLQKDGYRINYVFKPLPIPSHPYSKEAAIASLCANQSGKYWEYRAWLFENQQKFADGGVEALVAGAAENGMDSSAFGACIADIANSLIIDSYIAEGNASKVYQTPTFFVNGKPLIGPLQYGQLKTAVDAAYSSSG